jgi:hypothetical protein
MTVSAVEIYQLQNLFRRDVRKRMWPRLMDIKTLAAYISLSPNTIRNQYYGGTFPISAVRFGNINKPLWDKRAVDKYLDSLKPVDR